MFGCRGQRGLSTERLQEGSRLYRQDTSPMCQCKRRRATWPTKNRVLSKGAVVQDLRPWAVCFFWYPGALASLESLESLASLASLLSLVSLESLESLASLVFLASLGIPDANNPALASIPTTGSSNQFLYNDDRQHEFEPETRPYYGSLGRSPQPHQPHHRQQRQSRIGDKMRHSLDSEQRQQRQQQQRNSRRPANHGRQAETFHTISSRLRLGETVDQLLTLATAGQAILTRTIGLNDLLLYGADGKAAATAAPARRPAATATSGRQQRPASSATQHQRSRQRDTSGQRAMEPPVQQQPFATAGRLPFAPKQAATSRSGDLVKFTRYGGRISKGLVHFVGRLPGRTDYYGRR
uniref:CAP-Gly domain-containing protein n=1 Tax=Macrostomum lignano TaxID=282301 RepID=A0A1I8JPR5_9PLAT